VRPLELHLKQNYYYPINWRSLSLYNPSLLHKALSDQFGLDDLLLVDYKLRDQVFVHPSEHFVVLAEVVCEQDLNKDEVEEYHG